MLTQEKIDELKAEHGSNLWLFNTSDIDENADDDIVLRAPKPAEFKCFRDNVADDDKLKSTVVDTFVTDCVVYPSKDEFRAILKRYPGIVTPLSVKAQELAGSTRKLQGKAL